MTVAPYAGAWIESVQVVDGRFHTFLCVRKFLLFFSLCKSMYLTVNDLHIPVFRAFLHFLVTVDCCKRAIKNDKPMMKSLIFPAYSPASQPQL